MAGMWVEKYRPTTLQDIIGQKDTINSILHLLKNVSQMPHLLFSGSAGVGKTTAALCIARQVLGENRSAYTLELNASDERGIDMVREKVKKFSRFAGMGDIPFKIIILDEADEMTSGAQTALRRIIEDASEYCRFIIIANNISKIIDPIQSRCAVFRFTAIQADAAIDRMSRIAEYEGVKADRGALKAIYDSAEGDMRHCINMMQAAVSENHITIQTATASASLARTSDVNQILLAALDGDFKGARTKMIELIKVYGMSESDFLKYMSSAAFQLDRPDTAGILHVIAEYDYRILSGANPEIQLSAMLAQISSK